MLHMSKLSSALRVAALLTALLLSMGLAADEWRSEPLSAIDRQYIDNQRESLDALARRHLGRTLNGTKDNDLAVLQRMLDEGVVGQEQVRELQAMGLVLGELLKKYRGLVWVIYSDKYGRSRSLQVPGFEKEFIFPATQISRRAEVGLKVDVRKVYAELEQAITDIRNKPPF